MDLPDGLRAALCPVLVVGGELDPVMPIERTQDVTALSSELDRLELTREALH